MKTFVITLVALVASATAVPAAKSAHIDIYRNTLEAPGARIVGGENAERHQFPHQASLLWGFLGSFSHICGGTLIAKRWVLTAAHCKPYSFGTYQIVLGQLNQNENHADVQSFEVVQFITNPGYPGGGAVAADDIAVIELDRDAELTDAVQIAPLAEEEDCNAIVGALLSGWGLLSSSNPNIPVRLQWAELPRISNEQCADDLASLLGSSDPLDETMICTSANSGLSQSSCSGDSGGPLLVNNKLAGVVSWGISPCGYPRAPSVFTRVCSHLDFINEHVTNSSVKQ